jgi:DNA-binding IclR family transcriptional regulator
MVQALSRCVEILKYVGDRPAGVNPADLSRAMNLKYTTVYNLVQSLEREKLLERDRNNKLRLGIMNTMLHGRRWQNACLFVIEDRMRGLAQRYDCTMTYSYYDNGQLLGRAFENGVLRDIPRVLNMYDTVSGVVHAAFLPVTERRLLLERNRFNNQENTRWHDANEFVKAVEHCRKRHFAVLPYEQYGRVGIPQFCENQLVGVITMEFKNASDKEWLALLKRTQLLSRVRLESFNATESENKEIS